MSPRCPSDEELVAYLRDPYRDRDSIADHLDNCPGCDDRAERLRPGLAPPEPSPESVEKILLLDFPARPVPEDQKPRIDGYEVLGEIGRGGMGVVYKAWHARFFVVALKVLLREALATPAEVEQARREAREAQAAWEQAVASGDPDPPFIRVYEVGETLDGVHFIFISMELVPAGNLQDRLRELGERPQVVAELLRTVAQAVHAMHERGVVHRDLTLRNILLRVKAGRRARDAPKPAPLEDLEPVVSDYGLSKRMTPPDEAQPEAARTSRGELKGTPYYMAPELLRSGSVGANARTDVFALGVVLYLALTGRRPFDGDSILGVQNSIVRDEPRRPRRLNRRLPRGLEAICLKCLEKDPRRRYASAADLAEDLGRFLARDPKDPVRARLPGTGRRLGRWCRRNPLAVTAFAASALVASSTIWALRRDRDAADARATLANQAEAAARARGDLESAKVKDRERSIHQERVQEARVAARRGDWPTALQAYRRAIDDRLEDEARLRAERLFGFFAVNDEANLIAELAALERRPDLGRLAAHLALVRGAHLLCDSGRQEEGRASVRRALESSGDLLSEADILFARALIETRARPMIEALRGALERDFLHYQARASLVVALLGSGQPEEAVAQADQLAGLFPASPVPPFTHAIVAALHGDRQAMHAGLDATAARLKVDPAPLVRYFDALVGVLDIMARAEDRPGEIDGTTRFLLSLAIPQLQARAATAGKPIAFAVPSISLMFRWSGDIFEAARDSPKIDDEALRRLEDLARDRPEALIRCLIVGNRLGTACAMVNANRPREGREALASVAELAYSAADAPSILVRSPIRYQTRFIGLFADAGFLKLGPADDRARVLRMRDNLHRLVADGRRWKSSRQQCIPFLLQMMTSKLTPELAADWKLDTPDGLEAFRRRNLSIARMGRALLEDWLDDEPENPAAQKWLVDLNRWADRFQGPATPPAAEP